MCTILIAETHKLPDQGTPKTNLYIVLEDILRSAQLHGKETERVEPLIVNLCTITLLTSWQEDIFNDIRVVVLILSKPSMIKRDGSGNFNATPSYG